MRFYSFLLLCVLTTPILATDMSGSHAQGQKLAQDMQGNVQGAAKETSASTVPGYTTDKPSQASLGAEALGDAALEETKRSEAGKVLKSVTAKRKKFTLSPEIDPLLRGGNEILKDPHTVLDVKMDVGAEKEGTGIMLTCEEAGSGVEQACHHTLTVTLSITPAYTTTSWRCEGYNHPIYSERQNGDDGIIRWEIRHHTPNSPDCFRNHPRCVKNYQQIHHPEVITIAQEEWSDDCARLEKLTDEGLCQYRDKICSDGPSTKMVQDRPITKDCWQYRQTYQCKRPSQNNCAALRAKGCVQKSSQCKEWLSGTCVVWRQTYDCPSSKKSLKNIRAGAGSPFCVTGNCADSSYQANGEMLQAMAHLSVFQEMQKDIREGSFEIFKGTDKTCSRNCIDFKDCCQNMKGWGTSLHLASCSEEERLLAKLKAKNLCHQVGTYCAKKVLGVCVSKKTSYCCFGSKLLRLLQEQGRAQLGIGWGEASNPCCRGLKPAELGRIDFSQIDMSEIFEDIIASYKQPDTGSFQKRVSENLKGTLRHIQAGTKEQPLHTGEKGGL